MYRVFKRKAWRKDSTGKFVPHPGARKTTIDHVETATEARAICLPHNAERPENFGQAAYYNFMFYEFERVS